MSNLEKKVVAYYRTGDKYDTPLDTLDIQQRRVAEWASKNKYEIVASFHDIGEMASLEELYDCAGSFDAYVIVATPCRICNTSEEFMSYSNEISIPLLTTESMMDTETRKVGLARTMTLVEAMMFAQREYYINMCKKWIG